MQRLNPVRKFRRPVFAIAKAVDSRSEQVNRTTVIFSNSSPLPAMTNPSARATRGCCHPNRLRDAATCSTAASLCLGLTALHRNS